jgi:RNA polymerase nonessential primary-like sigma factor
MLSHELHAAEIYRPGSVSDTAAKARRDGGVNGGAEPVRGWQMLDSETERELISRMSQGDSEAAEALIGHNIGLVLLIAKRYLGRGLPLLDLVEEGKLGLMHALDKFDPDRGFRLSVYAIWWIRQAIDMVLSERSFNVRHPTHAAMTRNDRLRTESGPESPAAHARVQSVGVQAYRIELESHVADWVGKLPYRHRRVIERRFGLNGHVMATLDELAAELELSRGQVQAILAEAQGEPTGGFADKVEAMPRLTVVASRGISSK